MFGAFLAVRWRRVLWLHLPCAVWGALIELTGSICPLTPLENSLRRAAGGAGYSGGFIERYLIPALYPAGLTRPVQIALGVAVIVFNATLYAWIFWRRNRETRGNPDLS